MRKSKHKITAVERDLIEGLSEFLDVLKSDESLDVHFTCRKVTLDVVPPRLSPEKVKATRSLLGLSQTLFAQFLGVSSQTVRAWEQGKKPSDMACRFLDEIRRNPTYWRARVKESLLRKKEAG